MITNLMSFDVKLVTVSTVIAGLFVLGLSGCNSSSKSSDKNNQSSPSTVEMKELFGNFQAEKDISTYDAEALGYVIVIDGKAPERTRVDE